MNKIESKLMTIKGYTCRAWPLVIGNNTVGYYFDNPGTPGNLNFLRDSNIKEEDHLKTGKVYMFCEHLLQKHRAFDACAEFAQRIGERDVQSYLYIHDLKQPDVGDLLIYAVECGVTNLDMLRAFKRKLVNDECMKDFVDTFPQNEPHWCIALTWSYLFIQPDGSVCS